MNFKLHIPFVNRVDLLEQAILSVRDIGNIHVWLDGVQAPNIRNVTFHWLPPLPFSSVMNLMIQSSIDTNDDVMFFMHNDGLALNNADRKLLKRVEQKLANGEQWGAIFTTYDVLCAFNVAALKDTGYWDTMFMQYTGDVDYYHRMRSNGWQIEVLKCNVLHQNDASNTIKADPLFNARTQWREQTGFDKSYYQWKFGGMPGEETHRAFEGVA